ncbi:MAG TPA: prepilin-type N-terminal cleavage/methylation domain-containing protein [Phycisphaerae bacterium]
MARSRCNLAFTLLELLVVIAVIAALVAILLPSLAGAKSQAKTAVCASALRQWGVASREYSQQYSNYIPGRGQGQQPMDGLANLSNVHFYLYWYNSLPPMLDQPAFSTLFDTVGVSRPDSGNKFWICPEAVDDFPANKVFFSYGQNMDLSPTINSHPDRLNEIGSERTMVLMGDGPSRYCSIWPTVTTSPKEFNPVTRHRKNANLLFLDGHVMAYPSGSPALSVNPMTDQQDNDEVRWKTPNNTWPGPSN